MSEREEKLRCWPGCVAQITAALLGKNLGKRVRVIELAPDVDEYGMGPHWSCVALQPMESYSEETRQRTMVPTGFVAVMPDRGLRPIEPDQGVVDTTTDGDVPALFNG